MKQKIVTLSELPDHEGLELVSEPFSVSFEDQRLFEESTWMPRIYPPDQESAPDYPEGMIEGFHTLGLLDVLVHEMFRVDPGKTYAFNYGLDNVRFPAGITVTDSLVLTATIAKVVPRNGGYLVTYHCEITAVGATKPGMVADWHGLVLPRASTLAADGAGSAEMSRA